jgi:hypothetical protein
MSSRDDYEEGYEKGYDDGYDAGIESSAEEEYEKGYEDALNERGIKNHSAGVDNLCFKCDCRTYGSDCVLEDPRAYMENKKTYGEDTVASPPHKKVTNTDYDRAMEIFDPK